MPESPFLPDDLDGLTDAHARRLRVLADLLEAAARERYGDAPLDLLGRLRTLGAGADADPAALDAAAELVRAQDVNTLSALLRTATTCFHLANEAERLEIVRVNRVRARDGAAPPDSLAEAVDTLAAAGRTADDVRALLGRLDVVPTLTAHPTEARRRTILFHQQDIAAGLVGLDTPDATPAERDALRRGIANDIRLLLATDEVRTTDVTVEDEVRYGLYFLATTIWTVLPRFHADLRRALREAFPDAPEAPLPPFLRYRSWIGGDRDGNPRVTADVTAWTFRTHREDALRLHLRALDAVRLDLSISDQQVDVPTALLESIEADRQAVDLTERRWRQHAREPFRLKVLLMQAKLQRLLDEMDAPPAAPLAYDASAYRADLVVLADALRATGLGPLADDGPLADLQVRAEAFGFHLAALDVRQHSRVHEAAVDGLLRAGGAEAAYASLDEPGRLAVLTRELQNPRPLLPPGAEPGEAARDALNLLVAVREAAHREPESVGGYIISMTSAVSDVLEVLLLLKEAGLWRRAADGHVTCAIDVAPLFETIADLEAAPRLLTELFAHPVYAAHLAARGDTQEVMLGYSDSNKDGGYWMANWALHGAQGAIARTCRDHGVALRYFHGRGGTVGRGGGRAGQAIRAIPAEAQTGAIRFTEQGEVISFRYANPGIAHRHLEQIVHAQLLALDDAAGSASDPIADDAPLLDGLAATSMDAYRALIDDPAFWPWYREATPIDVIAGLRMASRPLSRKAAGELDFEGIRAIPWVFAWTQPRYGAPGWYGVGSALAAAQSDDEATLDRLRRLHERSPFLRAVVANARRELARSRLVIARRYAANAPQGDAFHSRLAAEARRATEALCAIAGVDSLLADSPVIAASIRLRNPVTDVLNLVQLELLARDRATGDEALDVPLAVSINGLAAAMQSTG